MVTYTAASTELECISNGLMMYAFSLAKAGQQSEGGKLAPELTRLRKSIEETTR